MQGTETDAPARVDRSADRAAHGATMLDRDHPTWATLIDVERLSLSSWEDDIQGQLARHRVLVVAPEGADIVDWAGEHGFNSYSRGGEYSTYLGLEAAWRALVAERLTSGAAA